MPLTLFLSVDGETDAYQSDTRYCIPKNGNATGVRSPVLSCLTELPKSLNTALLKSTMHEKYTYISLVLTKMLNGARFRKLNL